MIERLGDQKGGVKEEGQDGNTKRGVADAICDEDITVGTAYSICSSTGRRGKRWNSWFDIGTAIAVISRVDGGVKLR